MENDNMKECPYCGSDDGYYTKSSVRGTVIMRSKFDGSDSENGDMYDYLTHKYGKTAYCLGCKKKLFKIQKEEHK